ncbi:hypothetical protein A9976_04450 [Delftia sp. UME58]|nr:hypothetical protein [Delftia sp. UME58]
MPETFCNVELQFLTQYTTPISALSPDLIEITLFWPYAPANTNMDAERIIASFIFMIFISIIQEM